MQLGWRRLYTAFWAAIGWLVGLVVLLKLGVTETLAPPLALLLGAITGYLAYSAYPRLLKRSLDRLAMKAINQLTPLRPPGETLQAFVYGFTGPSRTGPALLLGLVGDTWANAPHRNWYYVGLTRNNLLLLHVRLDRSVIARQVLPRADVSDIKFETGTAAEAKLIVGLPAGRLDLRVEYPWIQRAKDLEHAWRGLPAVSSPARKMSVETPAAGDAPRSSEAQAFDEAWRLPMRVGAGIMIAFAAVLGLALLLLLVAGARGAFLGITVVSVSFNAYYAYSLLTMKEYARRGAIRWAVIELLASLALLLGQFSWLYLFFRLTYTGSLLLLFFGKPSRPRAMTAGALFTLGWLLGAWGIFAPFLMRSAL